MKVLFFITGIGYGDIIRQHAIIKKLNAKIKIATYHKGYEYFKNKYSTIKIHSYKFPDKSFKLKPFLFLIDNLFSLPLQLIDLIRLYFISKKFNPDVIVSDLEPLAIPISKLLKKKLITIFGTQPSILKEIKPKSIFLKLQKLYLQKLYSYGTLLIPSLTGKSKNSINPIVRESKGKLNLPKKPILIMLGGSQFGITVADELIKILPSIDEDFIIFGYKKDFKEKNITCYKFKENFLDYLKASKAVITLAGHSTLSELVVYKKPSLIFPIQNHLEQQINGYVMQKNGLGMVKNLKEIDSELLKKYILEFLKKENKFEENLKKLNITGDGAKKAAEIILQE
jgi:uncharacterized protein (TIGR00661 family)